MEYTKGEWKVTQIGLDTLIQSFDKTGKLLSFKVASVNGETNARLIASAPDLYEALQGWLDWFGGSKEGLPPITKSERAIAKTEGN